MDYQEYVQVMEKIVDSLDLDISPQNLKAFKDCFKNVFPIEKNHKRLTYKVADFPNKVAEARAAKKPVNFDVVDELLHKTTMLLKAYQGKFNEYETPFILAVAEYFIEDMDATPDFDTEDGFDDDLQIMNAVIKHFELEELVKGSGIMIDTNRTTRQKHRSDRF